MSAQILCRLSDLDATGAKEIVLNKDGARVPVFVVKFGERVLGYVNSCPHVRLPLNWKEDSFLDVSGTYLFCANHGAHFDVVTGACLRGPCKGQSLTTYPVRVDGDTIVALESSSNSA
jgi:nitrite reductase/ring-hydroxylating ferredoxin subunit